MLNTWINYLGESLDFFISKFYKKQSKITLQIKKNNYNVVM